MILIERMIQELVPGKFAELVELDRRYDAIEIGMGFPAKKRFWCISGTHDLSTSILEREWESMAAMEAAYEKSFANPEIRALNAEGASIVVKSRIEYYTPA